MQLDPRRGLLCVVQATITTASGSVEFASLSMPTAPFGTPAWQLPNLVSYLHAHYDRRQPPTASSFTDHMRGRTALPSPAADYPYAALHDDRVACLMSLVIEPGRETAWPQASLALVQQESWPARCSWSSLEHERGTLAVLGRALQEAQAEQLHLAHLMRQGGHPASKELHGLAERVTEWTRGMYDLARGAYTAARAAEARRVLRST